MTMIKTRIGRLSGKRIVRITNTSELKRSLLALATGFLLVMGWAGGMFGRIEYIERTVLAQEQNTRPGNDQSALIALKQFESAQLRRSETVAGRFKAVADRVREQGAVPVIVRVRAVFEPEGNLRGLDQIEAQRFLIDRVRKSLLRELIGYDQDSVKEFKYLPYLALSVNSTGVAALEASDKVLDIEEDILMSPALSKSVPLIGANGAWTSGYTGAGQTIALIDTGVDKSHPFLTGKVVSEACYSTSYASYGSTSLCPAAASSSTASNSALACNIPGQECKHGTLVAGVLAGSGNAFSGVAPDASLIAINVYSRFDDPDRCEGTVPCALSYLSDQVRGLERVVEIRRDYRIAAVNMSLSGRKYIANCDTDQPALKSAIDLLASFGIATVAPTGNRSAPDGIGIPACISTVLSVGATQIESGGQESVIATANSASFMYLLAPGGNIVSSVPGGEFESWQGTSMAAPHVAGTIALLKQRVPSATVGAMLTAMINTGTRVTDNRNGLSKPRIRADLAMRAMGNDIPAITGIAVTPISPTAREPFKISVTGSSFIPTGTKAFACMVGDRTCTEIPSTGIRVNSATSVDLENIALPSGTWQIYLETMTGASGRSRAFSVMVPAPPPTLASFNWNPINPTANQPFSGKITGTGFVVGGTQVYFCLFDTSTCTLHPAANVTVNSGTSLDVTNVTLPGGSFQVYVQTITGASVRSASFQVQVLVQSPKIVSYAWSPATPTENQPFSGIVTGSGFVSGGTQVFFCETGRTVCTQVASANITVSSATSLSVSSVSLRAGSWQVYVQNAAGASDRSTPFTIQPVLLQPTIGNYLWNPANPAENQPFNGIVTGTNFSSGNTQVYFCEVGASSCTQVPSPAITVSSLTSMTLTNVSLRSGSWQCYVQTPAGSSARSVAFTVTPQALAPTLSGIVLSNASPTALQPFSAVISGTNFVAGNTQVFFCLNDATTCQQHPAESVAVAGTTALNISNISLAAGSWQAYVRTAGGLSARTTRFLVQPPVLPPTVTTYAWNPKPLVGNEPFSGSITGTNFVTGGTQVYFCVTGTTNCSQVPVENVTVTSATNINLTGVRLQNGSWDCYVRTIAGNSPRSTPFTITAPQLTPSISNHTWNPATPTANQPTGVTILGSGFVAGNTQVYLCVTGTTTCFQQPAERVSVTSSTSLSVTGIYLLAGSWQLYVQTAAGSSERSTSFTVKPANTLLPTISGYIWNPASPGASAPFSGTVNGTNFVNGGTQVFFCVNGTTTCFQQPLESVRFVNSGSLSLSNIYLMLGTWQIYVQTSAGVSERSAPFTVSSTSPQQIVPVLSSFSYTAATLTAGQLFNGTITGSNFVVGATQVFFCQNEGTSCTEILAANIQVTSQTLISLRDIGLSSGTWQVYVQTPAGASNRSTPFTVQPQLTTPTVIGYTWSPSTPSANQLFNGTIGGTNFVVGATKVYFCQGGTSSCTQVSAGNVIVASTSSISLRNIQLVSGTWQFYVETAGGVSSRSTTFNVLETAQFLPTISGYSWSNISIASNQPFNGVITGTNFVLGSTSVYFCLNNSLSCTRHPMENISVTSPTSLTISNISLTGGVWQIYLQTTVGNSSRSTNFSVPEPPPSIPTLTSASWNPGSPASGQVFTGTINGTGFVTGETDVFFCVNGTVTCSQHAPEYVAVNGPTSLTVTNIVLAGGLWQVYVRTSAGTTARSVPFIVQTTTIQLQQPSVSSYIWYPLVPISGRTFTGAIRGSNFVNGQTKVFFCVNASNNCIEMGTTDVTANGTTTLNVTNIRLTRGLWQIYVETPIGISNRSRTFNVL